MRIYTDGSCIVNKRKGGWAYLIITHNNERYSESGYCHNTTNNKMELFAAIKALRSLSHHTHATLFSDSNYLIQGINVWIHRWKKRNWKNVKNISFWQQLDELNQQHNITWLWVKGHDVCEENIYVDRRAYGESLKIKDT